MSHSINSETYLISIVYSFSRLIFQFQTYISKAESFTEIIHKKRNSYMFGLDMTGVRHRNVYMHNGDYLRELIR